MMIWPGDIRFRRCRFEIERNLHAFEGPFHSGQQQGSYAGAMWLAEIELAFLDRRQAGQVLGLLSRYGHTGILLPDPLHAEPLGVGGGWPVTDGVNQGGLLYIREAPESIPGWLLAGDLIQVGQHMHLLTEDVNTDEQGRCLLRVTPYLRQLPADGTPVITHHCACLMKLEADQDLPRRVGTGRHYLSELTLSFREAIG